MLARAWRLSGLLGGACCDPGGRARAHALLVIKSRHARSCRCASRRSRRRSCCARGASTSCASARCCRSAASSRAACMCASRALHRPFDCLELCVVVCGGVWWPLHDRHSHAKRLKHCLVWSAVVLLRGGCCDGAGECRCTSVSAVGIDSWRACGRLCVRACVNNTFQLQCRGCYRARHGSVGLHTDALRGYLDAMPTCASPASYARAPARRCSTSGWRGRLWSTCS